MAQLEHQGELTKDPTKIATLMQAEGMLYERWGVRDQVEHDDEVLTTYQPEIDRLKQSHGYVTADLVALSKQTPNLEAICAKFDKEHHHDEDEVRFVVEGEGVFELAGHENHSEGMLKFTAEPGDLIVIPAGRRHAFYLTESKRIRCIRLFKTQAGWEAIYKRA